MNRSPGRVRRASARQIAASVGSFCVLGAGIVAIGLARQTVTLVAAGGTTLAFAVYVSWVRRPAVDDSSVPVTLEVTVPHPAHSIESLKDAADGATDRGFAESGTPVGSTPSASCSSATASSQNDYFSQLSNTSAGIGTLLAEEDDAPRQAPTEVVLHNGFPHAYYGWLARATNVEIVAVYLFQLIDDVERERFLDALGKAARRPGSRVWLALVCPESDAAIQRADELKITHPEFLATLEQNLWVLYNWQQEINAKLAALEPLQPRRVDIVLYSAAFRPSSQALLAPHYVCDRTLLRPGLPLGYPSQDADHLRYPIDHPLVQSLNDYRANLRSHGVPLEHHVLLRVVVELPGEPVIPNVKYVERGGATYLAVLDREAVTRLEQSERVTLYHPGQPPIAYRPVRVDSGLHPELLELLDGDVITKYCTRHTDHYFFFRLDEEERG